MKFTYMKTPLNRYTFKNKRIRAWVESNVEDKVLNLFAGKTYLNCDEVRNDLDPTMNAEYHLDALEFCKNWKDAKFNTVILDAPYCYDSETEILTENGWKYFFDLQSNEKIATLNNVSNKLEYQNITNYVTQYYSGKMVRIKSGSVDLLVTPNHDLYVRKLWKSNSFNFIKAGNLNFGCNFKCDCDWDGKEQEYFILPGVSFERHNRYGEISAKPKIIKMDDWLRFLGIYLAEGSVDPNGIQYRIRIAQMTQSKKTVIEPWIANIGFNYIIEKKCFTIYNKQLCTYLRQFGKSTKKFIPKELKYLSKRQLQIFFDSIMFGDGHISETSRWNDKYKKYYIDRHRSYSSTSKQLIDDMSEISLKLGYVPIFYKLNGKRNQIYNLNLTNVRTTPIIRKKLIPKYIKEVDYVGKIYCVSVPNRLIYVRRNGKPVWCGNSYRKSMEMYNGKVMSPFNALKDAILPILTDTGIVITFGYHSNSMGEVRGFKQEHILLLSHGGAIHDTIAVIERRVIKKNIKWAGSLFD